MLRQHVHDDTAVGHAGGLLGVGLEHVLEHLHQHGRGAVKEHLPVARHPGARVRLVGSIHWANSGSFTNCCRGLPSNLPKAISRKSCSSICRTPGNQYLRCLGGAQHRAGKHQRHLRVAKILFQRFQLGAALRTQGQVAAAANIQAFQVSLRQGRAGLNAVCNISKQYLTFYICIIKGYRKIALLTMTNSYNSVTK